jgi:SAM-dependent methyltransferase
MIARACTDYRNPQNALFLVADASGIPCRDELFDALLNVESIYYYPGLDLAFHEVHRILKPGGKAFFLISYYKENVYGHEWAKHIDIPVHLLGADEYIAILAVGHSAARPQIALSRHRGIDTDSVPTRGLT